MNIGFIGYGNMGAAIADALSNDRNQKVLVKRKSKRVIKNKKIKNISSLTELINKSEIIFLAVKPNTMKTILNEILALKIDLTKKIFISIAAGISISFIKNCLGEKTKVVRIMPNLPVLIGEGVISITFDKLIKVNEKKVLINLFKDLGEVIAVREDDIHSVIALSGSAPAYLALYAKALLDLGCELGLKKKERELLVFKTIKGSASYFLNEGEDMDTFIKKVCSKGGTTIEAINFLKKNKFLMTVKKAAKKTSDKSKILTKDK